MEKYNGFEIPIATPEKAIIDFIGRIPVSSLEDAFEGIDAEKLVSYAKKTGKKSTMKRIGYLLEKNEKNNSIAHRQHADSFNADFAPIIAIKPRGNNS